MAKTFQQIQQQIDALTRQAEDLRRKEIAGVVDRIKGAIATYGLSAAELGLEVGSGAAQKAKAAAPGAAKKKGSKVKVKVKYRDEAGNTWTGRGLKPRWLTAALANGKQLTDFLV